MPEKDKGQEAASLALDVTAAAVNLVPVVGGFVGSLIEASKQRGERRIMRMFEKALNDHGLRLDQLEESLGEENLAELIHHTIRVTIDARSEEKLDALAAIVSAAARPGVTDAHIERSHMLLTLLAGLEDVHIKVLMAVGSPHAGEGQLSGVSMSGTTVETMKLVRQDLADVADAVVAQLEAQGLLSDVSGMVKFRGTKQLVVTPLGAWFLETLRQRRHT